MNTPEGQKIYNKQYREKNKEKIAEKRKEYSKKHYRKHKEAINKRHKENYNKSKNKINIKQKKRRDNLTEEQIILKRDYQKNWYKNNLDKIKKDSFNPIKIQIRKNRELIRDFNITLEEYNQLLLSQNGVCAICGEPETSTNRGKIKCLSVDHDHETGKIRGLLCQKCNQGLGNFKDSLELIEKTKQYLIKYEK